MHIQFTTQLSLSDATYLTDIIVAFACFLALFVPIWPIVRFVATAPVKVVFTAYLLALLFSMTCAAAMAARGGYARRKQSYFSAGYTSYRDWLFVLPSDQYFCMRFILTGTAAIFRSPCQCLFQINNFPAFLTRYWYLAAISYQSTSATTKQLLASRLTHESFKCFAAHRALRNNTLAHCNALISYSYRVLIIYENACSRMTIR